MEINGLKLPVIIGKWMIGYILLCQPPCNFRPKNPAQVMIGQDSLSLVRYAGIVDCSHHFLQLVADQEHSAEVGFLICILIVVSCFYRRIWVAALLDHAYKLPCAIDFSLPEVSSGDPD